MSTISLVTRPFMGAVARTLAKQEARYRLLNRALLLALVVGAFQVVTLAPRSVPAVADPGLLRLVSGSTAQPSAWTSNLVIDAGAVSTVAGSATSGSSDGVGSSATFDNPAGASVAGDSVYVVDSGRIREASRSTHEVTTIAGGGTGSYYCQDSTSSSPAIIGSTVNNSLVNDGEFLYWLDTACQGYGALRKMDLVSHAVTTVWSTSSSWITGTHLTIDTSGAVILERTGGLYRIDTVTGASTLVAQLSGTVKGLAADAFVWASTQTSSGTQVSRVNTLTGQVDLAAEQLNSDPAGPKWELAGAMVSAGGYLYLVAGYSAVLKINKIDGSLEAVAGGYQGGFVEGTGPEAWFSAISGIDSDGTRLWIADVTRVRVVELGTALPATQPSAWSTSLDIGVAGTSVVAGNGVEAVVDGQGPAASFRTPYGMAVHNGYGYTYDSGDTGGLLRRINLSTGDVTTIAGPGPSSINCTDNADPVQARLGDPRAMTMATDGTFLYWLDHMCHGGGTGVLRRMSLRTGAISRTIGADSYVAEAMTLGPGGEIYIFDPHTECHGVCHLDPETGERTLIAPIDQMTYNGSTFPIEATGMTADATTIWLTVRNRWSNGWPQFLLGVDLATGAVSTRSIAVQGGSDALAGPLVSAGGELYLTNTQKLYSVNKSTGLALPVLGVAASNITGLDTDGTNLYLTGYADHRIFRLTQVKPISYIPQQLIDDYPTDGLGPTEFPGGGNLSMICACSQGQTTDYPINTQNGSFWHTFTDLTTPGPGPGVNVARTYVSANNSQDSAFGKGWSWSYGAYLTQDTQAHAITVHQEDGSTVAFTQDDNDNYSPLLPRMMASLDRSNDGTYTFIRKKRQILRFDRRGHLIAVKDLNGYATTLAYDNDNDLDAILDDSGRRYEVTTNTAGHITTIEDPAGHSYNYGYDNGDLVSVTDPTGAESTFTYGSAHRMLTWTDPNQQDALNPTPLTNTYDQQGRVTSQTDFRGKTTTFDYYEYGSQHSTQIHDPAGDHTVDVYNAKGLRTNHYSVTPADGWVGTSFTYNPTTFALASQTDPRGKTSTFTYDGRGNLLTSTDPLGNQITNTYNSLNALLTSTDANGVTTTHTYDSAGNILTSSRPLLDSGGAVVDTATTTYHYNDPNHPGQVTGVTDPEGHTTHYAYNGHGDLTTVTTAATPDQPTGSVVTYTYDPDTSWRTSMVSARGNAAGGDPDDYLTRYYYDEVGRVVETRDPEWDSGTPNRHRTTATYDDNGNLVSSRDARNNETTYTYNRAGQLVGTHYPDDTDTHRSYHDDGLLATTTDQNGEVTSYEYSGRHQVTAVTDPLGRSTHYTYDLAGNRLTTRYQGGSCDTAPTDDCIKFQYDNANQLTHINYSDTTASVDYDYDDTGRLVEMSDGTGTSTWDYDSLDRLTATTDGDGSTVSYGYDLAGNRTTVTYPGNHTVTNAYNNRGQVTAVTDWNTQATTFHYDPDGNLTTQTQPNGLATAYDYDPNGTIGTIDLTVGTTPLESFDYTRNDTEQITATTETGALTAAKSYGYDDLGQLTTDTGQTYGYDPARNPEVMANGPSAQAFDDSHQLITSTTGAVTTSYDFDNRGNRTTETSSLRTRTFATNLAGSLTEVTTTPAGQPTQAATAEYDGHGLRVNHTGPSGTQHFTYDQSGGMPLVIADGQNYYLYGPAGPIAQIDATSGTTSYLSADQLGSTRIITDPTATVTGTYTYDAYGNTTTHTGTATSPLQFNAQYHDTDTNLYWLRARHYDPTTAQFLTRDPLETKTGQPYTYAANDPLNADDPLGLFPSLTSVLEKVDDLNPMKPMINGFIAEYVAYDTGCGFADSFMLGMRGTFETVGLLATLPAPEVRAGSFAARGLDDGMDLYRHVSPEELADIAEHGFRPGLNSLGGKWFAESAEHASEWGRILNNGEGSVVNVRVSGEFAGQLMRLEKLDGIGPARYVEPDQLGMLNRFGWELR